MAVDALVALRTESLFVSQMLERFGVGAQLAAQHAAARPTTLAPSPDLREWIEALEDRPPLGPARDDLPELLIPERLVPRLRQLGIDAVLHSTSREAMRRIKHWDAEAAKAGLTLTEWILSGALAARRS